jgi:F-type H+-transporting ATPase subunit b
VLICLLAFLLACSVGSASASSGGDQGDAAHQDGASAEGHGDAAGHGEEGGHGAEGGHGGKGWEATDTYRVMNFSVLALGLFFLLRKPAANALNGRIQGIKDELSDLEARKAEAERKLSEYSQKFATLDQEREKIIAQYIQQGEDAKARILEEAKAAATKLEAQAQKNIENEFTKARAELQEEILDKAMAKAEEIIRAKITSDDQEKLVDEYLAKVVA